MPPTHWRPHFRGAHRLATYALFFLAACVVIPSLPTNAARVNPTGANEPPPAPSPIAPSSTPVLASGPRLGLNSYETRDTLSVGNGSLFPGNVIFPGLGRVWYVAYVPGVNRLYLSVDCTIYEVNPSTLSIVGTLSASGGCGIVYLPSTGDLYLSGPSHIVIVDPFTDAVVGRIYAAQAGQTVYGLFVYDAFANAIIVGNAFNSTANVVALSQGRVIANLSIGYSTIDGVYDPADTQLYLAGYEDNEVEIVNSTTWTIHDTVLPTSLFGFMYGVAADPGTGNVYATTTFPCPGCFGTAYLVEISGVNGSIIQNRSLGVYPTGIVYDDSTNELFVADSLANAVYVVAPNNLTLIDIIHTHVSSFIFVGPWWLAYVPQLATIYAPTSWEDSLLAISDSQRVVYLRLGQGFEEPTAEAYDPACECLVVGDYLANRLYFINETTYALFKSVGLPGSPRSITYDRTTRKLWVSMGGLTGSLGIAILDASNGTYLRTLSSGVWSSSITFDTTNDKMFVPSFSSDVVDVYNATNLSLIDSIPVGPQSASPGANQAAWDPNNDCLYLSDWNEDNVTVLNASSDSFVTNITDVPGPDSISYDPTTGDIYTADQNAPNITVLDPSTNSVVRNFSVQYPASLLPLPGTHFLLATNVSGEVTEINLENGGTTEIAAGSSTDGLALLPSGTVAVSDISGAVYFLSKASSSPLTTPILSITPSLSPLGYPVDVNTTVTGGNGALTYSYDGLPPGCGSSDQAAITCTPTVPGFYLVTVSVNDSRGEIRNGSAVIWVEPSFVVTVEEQGLPSGTGWWLNLTTGLSFYSTGSSITFQVFNGTFYYTLASANRSFDGNAGRFTVNGAAEDLSVEFHLLTYSVLFTEKGLPADTQWSVELDDHWFTSAGSTLDIPVPNGTFHYTIKDIPGWHESTLAYSGNLTVDGSSFALTPLDFFQVTYAATFNETGLPHGTEWWLNLSGGRSFASNNTTVSFALPNGTYSYVVASAEKTYATPPLNFTVNGSAVARTLNFSLVTYNVRLTESGLPPGTEWWLNQSQGPSFSSDNTTLSFGLPNGTYAFTVALSNKTFAALCVNITVNGGSVARTLNFTQFTYPVCFTEAGLPNGTLWSVSLTGVTPASLQSTSTELVGALPNGTYQFIVGIVSGYRANMTSGEIRISGHSLLVQIDFVPVSPGKTVGTSTGNISASLWAWIAIAIAVGAVIAVVLLRARRSRPEPPPKN